MKLLKTLGNPMALVVQGFTLGAALFFATHAETARDIAQQTFASAAAPAGTAFLL
jgi:hypothetical protein